MSERHNPLPRNEGALLARDPSRIVSATLRYSPKRAFVPSNPLACTHAVSDNTSISCNRARVLVLPPEPYVFSDQTKWLPDGMVNTGCPQAAIAREHHGSYMSISHVYHTSRRRCVFHVDGCGVILWTGASNMGRLKGLDRGTMLSSSCWPNVQASCATRMHRFASEVRDSQCREASTHTQQVHAAELDGDTKLSTWGEGCIESGVASGTKRYCR
jgi:hypothetical protein